MAAVPARVGAETSTTRDTLLDSVEKLMVEEGYASITYRALAAKAGVKPSLVQYYFPKLDDIFLAAISRYSARNIEFLAKMLEKRPEAPLHALWDYGWAEATGALMAEFMALGNHRKPIRAEIAEVARRVREVQLDALIAKYGTDARLAGDLTLDAALMLITGFPKLLILEEGLGGDTAHAEVIAAMERYLDSIEPAALPRKRKSTPRSRRR